MRPTGKARRVLEAIPRDAWLTAGEIGARIGMHAMSVAMIIRNRLLWAFVDRRPAQRKRRHVRWEYRRLTP